MLRIRDYGSLVDLTCSDCPEPRASLRCLEMRPTHRSVSNTSKSFGPQSMAPGRSLFACLRISVIRATTSLATFIAIDILMCAYILVETFGWVFNLRSLQTL